MVNGRADRVRHRRQRQEQQHDEEDHGQQQCAVNPSLLVFTAITVAVNQVHLAVPFAITVALIIAATKGSMVAAVFMHLSHEKKWIYGALLLTVVFFVVLLFVPLLTVSDTIGTPIHH